MEKRLFYREIPKVDSFLETEEIKEFDWLVFTSGNGVRIF